VHTLKLLHRHKPEILLVQSPSLSLTVLAILTRRVYRYCLVVDGHNQGVTPFHRRGLFVAWLTRRVLMSSDTTTVTNGSLAEDVSAAGGRPLVLPECLPVPLPTP